MYRVSNVLLAGVVSLKEDAGDPVDDFVSVDKTEADEGCLVLTLNGVASVDSSMIMAGAVCKIDNTGWVITATVAVSVGKDVSVEEDATSDGTLVTECVNVDELFILN
ncbi:hypothetical protein DPMN_001211 [Dreissena polymorpha]|uniref:Uncharacterized protein n=1 Tax=Dreissena polymorpha TaxID=45954 RepID=A0A9D4RSM0_DREPO|nr:hypothetical protein DPMN_001211 [Dreissena polymorpha]